MGSGNRREIAREVDLRFGNDTARNVGSLSGFFMEPFLPGSLEECHRAEQNGQQFGELFRAHFDLLQDDA